MKKTIFLAGIAVLVMVLGTCSLFSDPADGFNGAPRVEIDEQGQKWITLDIYTGGDDVINEAVNRSMNLEIAKVAVNYYEVIFFNGTDYYRAAGIKGKVLTVRLPDGFLIRDVADPDDGGVIAFAGYWDKETDDRTLLATGLATFINHHSDTGNPLHNVPTTGAGAPINDNTFNIYIELQAVETIFLNAVASNFQITVPGADDMAGLDAMPGPTKYSPRRTTTPGGTTLKNFASTGGTTSFNGDGGGTHPAGEFPNIYTLHPGTAHAKHYPFWRLPSHPDGIPGLEAKMTYTVGRGRAQGIIVSEEVDGDGTDPYMFASWAMITDNIDDGVTAVEATIGDGLTGGEPLGSGAAAVGATFTINIETLPAPVQKGYCLLIPSIPVRALILDPDEEIDYHTWMLRNGLFDYEMHDHDSIITGPPESDPSLGGALLLCIGEPASTSGKAIKIIFSKIEKPTT